MERRKRTGVLVDCGAREREKRIEREERERERQAREASRNARANRKDVGLNGIAQQHSVKQKQ